MKRNYSFLQNFLVKNSNYKKHLALFAGIKGTVPSCRYFRKKKTYLDKIPFIIYLTLVPLRLKFVIIELLQPNVQYILYSMRSLTSYCQFQVQIEKRKKGKIKVELICAITRIRSTQSVPVRLIQIHIDVFFFLTTPTTAQHNTTSTL